MMTPEEFRKLGHEVVDWIADYHAHGWPGPVAPTVRPGDVTRTLEPSPPLRGEDGARLLADFREKILPGVTHWNDPRFMGYFPCNNSLLCKEPDALKRALAMTPEYLRTPQDAAAENLRDWGIQLGRRFRALKLWFVLRSFGVEGLQEKLRLHLAMAREFAARVAAREGLALAAEVRLNTVCFRLPSDAATRLFHETLNATGEVFLTHAVVDGRYVVRVSFGQTNSTWDTLERLWTLVEGTLARPPFVDSLSAGR